MVLRLSLIHISVFARNKREELRARIAEFEEDANRMLEDRTTGVGIGAQDVSPLSPATPFGEYVERYIALRSNGAVSYTHLYPKIYLADCR